MKKKEILSTVTIVLFLLFLSTSLFTCYCFVSSPKQTISQKKLDKDDDLVKDLMSLVTRTTLFRKANYQHEQADDEMIIRYSYAMLDKQDSSWVKIIPKKIVCEVTNKVSFISSSPCIVQAIPNSVIQTYQETYFHMQKELTYPDLIIQGNKCVNDGKNYYCLWGNYVETSKTFSTIKEAYQEDDAIIIYEYYVKIETDSIDSCLLFYPLSYCQEFENLDIYQLDEDEIIEHGVLYKHTFRYVDDHYFLESSVVV